jgi:hypothetical protein
MIICERVCAVHVYVCANNQCSSNHILVLMAFEVSNFNHITAYILCCILLNHVSQISHISPDLVLHNWFIVFFFFKKNEITYILISPFLHLRHVLYFMLNWFKCSRLLNIVSYVEQLVFSQFNLKFVVGKKEKKEKGTMKGSGCHCLAVIW